MRTGISVAETGIVMCLIVVIVVVLLGGLSFKVSQTFDQTSASLGQSHKDTSLVTSEKTAGEQPVTTNSTPVSDILVRFGIFAAVVFAFMAYTITFVTKAETHGQVLLNQPPRKSVKDKHALVDLMFDRRGQIGRAIRSQITDFDSNHLSVSMFMTENPTTVNDSDQLRDVERIMTSRGFRHMMVVNAAGKLSGIISDRDMVGTAGKSIVEVMTPDPYSVEAKTPVSIAITLLVKNRISALPVVEDDRVVGVLTRSDLLVTLQCVLLSIQERLGAEEQPA